MGRRPSVQSTVLVAVLAGTIVVAGARVAEAGPRYSLGRKAVCAEKAVEVEIMFARSEANDRLVERAAAGRRAFPSRLRQRAIAGARVTASFFEPPTAPLALPNPPGFYLPDRVWRAGYQRGHLRALLFVRRHKGIPTVLFGVEGVPTDLDADYPEVRAVVVRYARWRQHSGDAESISDAEKTLASTSNASVATLASAFLCAVGHPDAVPRATGPCSTLVESCADW